MVKSTIKTNLFINFYVDKNADRQDELNTCLFANLLNTELNSITILISNNSLKALDNYPIVKKTITTNAKFKINITEKRPTLNTFFKATENYTNDINIICNTDIIIEPIAILKLKEFNFKNYVLALSRWDFLNKKMLLHQAIHFNRADSQDTWIKKGAFNQLTGANIYLGIAGVDNVIAHLFSKNHKVINPSLEIRTYHLHFTNVRNYITETGKIDRLPPPYLLVNPTTLPK